MYPDTDSPPTPITEERLELIKDILPELLWDREKRLKNLGLPGKLVKSLSISNHIEIFDKVLKDLDVNPTLVAITVEEKLKSLRREGKKVDLISDENIYQLFKMLDKNKFSKEAIPVILEFLAYNPDKKVGEAITELNLKPMSIEELEMEVDKVIGQYSNPKNTKRSINVIIGEVMKVVRNRVDGKLVKDVVTNKLVGSFNQ